MHEQYPFSSTLWLVYILLVLLALILKVSPYRKLAFLPIPLLIAYVLFFTMTSGFNADYILGLFWLLLLWFTSDYILITDIQRMLCQVPPTHGVVVNKNKNDKESELIKHRLV